MHRFRRRLSIALCDSLLYRFRWRDASSRSRDRRRDAPQALAACLDACRRDLRVLPLQGQAGGKNSDGRAMCQTVNFRLNGWWDRFPRRPSHRPVDCPGKPRLARPPPRPGENPPHEASPPLRAAGRTVAPRETAERLTEVATARRISRKAMPRGGLCPGVPAASLNPFPSRLPPPSHPLNARFSR